jgi:hypothetical protein
MTAQRIIPDRGEFVDVLARLRRGHVLVRTGESSGSVVIDGGVVWHSFPTLAQYGLIDEFDNPHGFPCAQYYRISACAAWRTRPLLQRLATRLAG